MCKKNRLKYTSWYWEMYVYFIRFKEKGNRIIQFHLNNDGRNTANSSFDLRNNRYLGFYVSKNKFSIRL